MLFCAANVVVECFTRTPVNLLDLERMRHKVALGWTNSQVRLQSGFCQESEEVLSALTATAEILQARGVALRHDIVCPQALMSKQSRFDDAPYRALLQNSYAANNSLRMLQGLASTVIDIDVTRLSATDRLLWWNLINIVTPAVLRWVYQEFLSPLNHPPLGLWRSKPWLDSASPERLPGGWRWCDMAEYQQLVVEPQKQYARCEDRVVNHDPLATGVFHCGQLLTLLDRQVLRFWALPTLKPNQAVVVTENLLAWLAQSAAVARKESVRSLEEAADKIPPFMGLRLPNGKASWLYGWQRY